MKLYFAPLEGITTFTYRNIHSAFFGDMCEYYAPFISPSENERISRKNLRDILPENNGVDSLKIQAMTNSKDAFLSLYEDTKMLGYDELNINLGCPATTVVKKGKGAGFLRNPDGIDRFFEGVFSKGDVKVSAKTRIGYFSADEMEELLPIYNRYPLSCLIVHPRTRMALYGGNPDMAVFDKVYEASKNPLVYNGDIVTASDYEKIASAYPELLGVMIGRGAVKNPAIFREISGGKPITTSELVDFSMLLCENYNKILDSDTFTLHKLKEVWVYMLANFPEEKKVAKAIKKATKLSDFTHAIKSLGAIE